MKSQRLLELLLRLQARSPRSARELAQSLQVTERTIYRDVDALSAAGIPIFTIRGSQGGIALREGYRQAISQLLEHEIRSLFTSGADPLIDLGFGEQLQVAREKLYGALSEKQRVYAVKVRERIRIEPHPWGPPSQPLASLSTLRFAVWEDRAVTIAYRNQSGQVAERQIHPLGLVFKAGVWYCVAQHGDKNATFRVERMVSLDLQKTRFKRPKDFRLDEFWKESQSRFEAKAAPCVVRVEGPLKHIEQMAVFWPTRIAAGSDPARATADIDFLLPGQAVHELLAWSSRVQAVSPAHIRAAIIERLTAALNRYPDVKQ
jgi:predicted DNA-binding transcriptional regulator YafY